MIATQNQQKETFSSIPETSASLPKQQDPSSNKIKNLNQPSRVLLSNRFVTHHPKAGLNTIADAAAYLFSVLGKLKQVKMYRHLNKLQKELIQEINIFQDTISHHGYNSEYILICRYILCATIDDVIANTSWGGQGQWETFSLLAAFNQDTRHQDKFFTILERVSKEPTVYIDLMELIYISLSLGYKGQYRITEHNQFQLEQTTHHLYKRIRVYRGGFSKTLSPFPIKAMTTSKVTSTKNSPLFILFLSACIILSIFISFSYLLDVFSNEAYKNLAQIGKLLSYETA